VSAHTLLAETADSTCVTVLRDTAHDLGKVFRADGSKTAEVRVRCAVARTVRCTTPEALAALIEEVGDDCRAALMLDHFSGINVGVEFLVVSQAELLERRGLPDAADRAGALGVHMVEFGNRVYPAVSRLKENISPSVWLALDRDINEQTPREFVNLLGSHHYSHRKESEARRQGPQQLEGSDGC
jgi:hypothetical protein